MTPTRPALRWPELGRIYQGDCLEIMRSWPDACVDHTITDPPYGAKTHEGARGGAGDAKLVHFDSITAEAASEITREILRVTRRWVIMTCEWQHAALFEAFGLPLTRLGVWVKPNGAPQFTGDRPGMGWEAVAILHREGKKRWNGGGHHAVWNVPKTNGKNHPTEKPLRLIERWVLDFSDAGEIILDPFCGSGTTCVAAEKLGRKWIGIELDPNYARIAQERVDAERSQGKLF